MERFFCSGSSGYLRKDSCGDLLMRDDVKAAVLKARGE